MKKTNGVRARRSRPITRRGRRRTRDEAARAQRARIALMGKVARDYWLYGRTQMHIAKTLKMNQSTVNRILKAAFELGVVEMRVDEGFAAAGEADDASGRTLRDRYELDDCISVTVLLLDPYDRAEDEYLHRALSRHAGQKLRAILDTGMHLCVSGGRAVYQAARVFARNPSARKNVRITPLCGRVWAHSWEPKGPRIMRPVDADDVAVVLAAGLSEEPGTVFSQVSYPLFAGDPTDAAENMEAHCRFRPDGTWRDNDVPDRALVGVGGIHPGGAHRFMDLIRGDLRAGEITPHLNSAAQQLREADHFVATHGLPHFGDFGNRLFPALPLPGDFRIDQLDQYSRQLDELQRSIDLINSRMVIANWSHLREIKHVLAIAGGPWKVKAVWTLLIAGYLHPDLRVVTELCTDTETAKTLTEALSEFNNQSKRIRDWYEQVTRRLLA